MEPLKLRPISLKRITAFNIGTVESVIEGKVKPELINLSFNAQDFSYGFQIGSPLDIKSLGEAVVVNGNLFATSTDHTSSDYGCLIAGPNFVTTGLFLLPKSVEPSFELSLKDPEGMDLYDLYQRIYEKIKKPLAFTGFISFKQLHANHIESPPINGLNIFNNPSLYYKSPPLFMKGVNAFVMGVMTDFHNDDFSSLNKKLEAVLYNNPHEETKKLTFHAHIITLEPGIKQEKLITNQTSKQVLHLFAEDTLVENVHLQIYIIDDIKEIP